jgi:hypothetical protein
MKILQKNPINLRQEISVWWIDFYQTSFSDTGLQEVLDFLAEMSDFEKSKIFENNQIIVSSLGLSDFLIEFSSAKKRVEFMYSMSQLPKKHGEYQFPELRGYFDKNGRYYALVGALYDFKDKNIDNNFWYGNIIFEIQGYIDILDTMEVVVDNTRKTLNLGTDSE